jgi:hypothetical protein
MNMIPKVRKHIFKLTEAFANVEQALEALPYDHWLKERAINTLQLKREALRSFIARNNTKGILALNIPRVYGTNIVWNIA